LVALNPVLTALKNALDLLPLLWACFDTGENVTQLMKLVSRRASSKEVLIGLLEMQESVTTQLFEWEEDEENNAGGRFCTLLDLYSEGKLSIGQIFSTNAINTAIPRITLRKKGPLDTLRPIMKGVAQCIGLASAKLTQITGRSLLQSLATLISSVSSWITSTPSKEQTESDVCKVILNDFNVYSC
jgi:hypothetical protein